MKRGRVKRTKQNPTRQRAEVTNNSGRVKNPATRDLPPNDRVDKYPDEVYGEQLFLSGRSKIKFQGEVSRDETWTREANEAESDSAAS